MIRSGHDHCIELFLIKHLSIILIRGPIGSFLLECFRHPVLITVCNGNNLSWSRNLIHQLSCTISRPDKSDPNGFTRSCFCFPTENSRRYEFRQPDHTCTSDCFFQKVTPVVDRFQGFGFIRTGRILVCGCHLYVFLLGGSGQTGVLVFQECI